MNSLADSSAGELRDRAARLRRPADGRARWSSGLARRSFLSLTALFVARRLRARRRRARGARLRPALGLRARPRDRRADRDPVPRRARGRGRDAPDARGTCRCASSCSAMPITGVDRRAGRARAHRPRLDASASCSARCCRRPTRCSPPPWSPTRACRGSCATRSTSSRASTTGSRCRPCSPSRAALADERGLRVVEVRAPGRDARASRSASRWRCVASKLMPRGRKLTDSIPAHQQSLYALGVAFATYGVTVGLPPEGNGFIAVFVVRDHARHPPPGPARELREPRRRHRRDRQARHLRRVRLAADRSTGCSATAGRRSRSSPSRCWSRGRWRSGSRWPGRALDTAT